MRQAVHNAYGTGVVWPVEFFGVHIVHLGRARSIREPAKCGIKRRVVCAFQMKTDPPIAAALVCAKVQPITTRPPSGRAAAAVG